jgi:hypothetical protein
MAQARLFVGLRGGDGGIEPLDSAEEDWLRHLHDRPVDGAELFGDPSELVLRDAALPENGQGDLKIGELSGAGSFVLLVGGDICRFDGRVAIDPISGQSRLSFARESLSRMVCPELQNDGRG